MSRRFLTLTLLAFVFGLLSLAHVSAQDAPESTPDESGDVDEVKAPEGLNPDRAVPGSEPTWWIKTEKPSVDVHETFLDNGLRVLIAKQGKLPLVSTFVWYDVGSAHEAAGVTGVAHYLEHMMFKGSAKYKKGDVDTITVRNGGNNNAFTSSDYTAYFFNLPSSNWTKALDIELDRMTTLLLEEKEFDAEKKVVQEESNRAWDDPTDRLWEDTMRNVFGPGHPYSHPTLGYPEDVAGMSVTEMRTFWETYYTPDNATLIVVGDVEPEAALEEVKKRFDSVPRSRRPAPRPRQTPIVKRANAELTMLAEVATARGDIILPSDSTKSIRNPIRDVLANVLAGGENSRLYARLVKEEGLCSDVGAFNYERRLGGTFHVSFSMLADKTEEDRLKARDIILEELRKIADEAPQLHEVARAIRSIEVSRIFQNESTSAIAQALGNAQIVYGDWRYMDHWLETVRKITPEDVRQVADDWKFDSEMVTAWLLPKPEETALDRDTDPVIPSFPSLDVQQHKLDNGMRLLYLPEENGPEVCTISFVVEAGKRTEALDRNGLTALFGATLDGGTATKSREEISAAFEELGASFGAGASGVSVRCLSKDLPKVVELCADVLQNASFPTEIVERERTRLLTAIASGRENHGNLAARASSRAIYGAMHPLGTRSAVSAEIMATITREELLEHYQRFVAPNNTRVFVVGRFDTEALTAQLTEATKSWKPSAEAVQRIRGSVPSGERTQVQMIESKAFNEDAVDANARVILVNDPDKSQCIVRMVSLGMKRNDPDYATAKVLDNILGTSPAFSDRMSQTLRDTMGLAYTVYANLADSSSEEEGAFLGYIGTRPSSVPQAIVGMKDIVDSMVNAPVTDEEIARAKSYLTSNLVFDLEGSGNLAGQIEQMDRFGLGFDYLKTYTEAVSAVTKEDITRVAKKYLDTNRMVVVVAGPIGQIPDAETFFADYAANTPMEFDESGKVTKKATK